MGTIKYRLVFLYCLAMSVNKAIPSQEVMQKLTTGFSKAFENCKTELNVEDQVLQDFYNFWRQNYELVNRGLGCMLLCMSSKFEMIDEDMKFHHRNAHEFAKAHGADDEVAKQLVTMIHDCETLHLGVTDHCSRVLEISKCFRTKIDGLKWTPSMEVILDEIINLH